nr:uncharacterized protein LOC128700253 [Cherax quadricarinatus]
MGEPRGIRGDLHLPSLGYLHPVHVLSQLARPIPLPLGVPPFTLTPPMPHALKMMGGGMGGMYPWGLNLQNHMLGSMRPGGHTLGRGLPSPDRLHDLHTDDGKVREITVRLTSELNIWFLDDGTLAGTKESLLHDLTQVMTRGQEMGLILNPSKCEIISVNK